MEANSGAVHRKVWQETKGITQEAEEVRGAAAEAEDEMESSGIEDGESSSESDDADDDAAAAKGGSNNGGGGDVRPRVQTRGARKQAEREERLPKSMPSASVCISFEASLWPTEDKEFTDGVVYI